MGFVLRFSSTVLANTLAYQREMLLRKHNAALLEMARNLFSSVSEFTLMHTHYTLSVHMPLNNIYIYIYIYIHVHVTSLLYDLTDKLTSWLSEFPC